MGAKYQKGLDKTKEFLRSKSALTIREVCAKAEIEPKDANILIDRFNKKARAFTRFIRSGTM